uniref:Uncharacterized protein n=1 Tax=Alexandrium catenella TaxID=2925 RepID=A0A7S1MA25_ALECA
MEIPQLWKDRCHSEVRPGENGLPVGAEEGANMNLVSLYGGVEFGLSRFNIAPNQRLPSFIPTEEPARPGLFAPARRAVLERGVNLDLIAAGGDVLQKSIELARAGVRPEGVDLNLDQFDLSEPTRVGSLDAPPDVATSGDFWSYLESDELSAEDEERRLLQKVFNPSLSDRRSEGDLFVPPDTSARYLRKLQRLVQEEADVQRQRKEHFFSQGFQIGNAGRIFPSSWSFSNAVLPESGLRRHPCDRGAVDADVLKSAVVAFDKSTEDGTRYRVYRFGSLEVRTTQDIDGKENIGAVFSLCASTDASRHHQVVRDDEQIVKATEYVEASGKDYHCYVVLETEQKNVIVTEELKNGTLRREANPKDLEDRCSLAKVLRSVGAADCKKTSFTVGGVKALQSSIYNHVSGCRAGSGLRMK